VLFAVTLCKYGHGIHGLNLGLMISWAVCSLLRITISVLKWYEVELGITESTRWIVYLVWWILEEINFIVFLSFMFKLKVIEIYMSPDEAKGSIQSRLKTLLRLMYTFFLLYVVVVTSQISIWFQF
jgi:hypothetical protein